MTTSPLPPTTASDLTGGLAQSTGGRTLDKDAFLRLLVTQLSNQDPLNPQNGQEFAAQLAHFSSVEQLTTIGKTLGSHSELLADLAAGLEDSALQQNELGKMLTQRADLTSAAGLIGQTVEAAGNAVVWDGAGPASIGLTLAGPAASVRVTVRDAAGQPVRTLDLGHLGAGRHTPAWDGLDDAGRPVAPGTFTVTVEAAGPNGEAVAATPFTRGRVDRVTIEAEGVRFWIGPHAVSMGDLRSLVS